MSTEALDARNHGMEVKDCMPMIPEAGCIGASSFLAQRGTWKLSKI
jgi:histidine ammonia-lyase